VAPPAEPQPDRPAGRASTRAAPARWRRARRALIGLVALSTLTGALTVVAGVVGAPNAGAAIALVQQGSEATATSGSVTATLPSASKAGDLLVAVLANRNSASSASFSGPTGWTNATGVFESGAGRVEIWYDANNAGGITSAKFTASTGTNAVVGALSEWSGAAFSAPVDQTGTVTHASATSVTVSTSASTSIAGDLAVTGFVTSTTPITTFTAGAGWTHAFTDSTRGVASDREQGLGVGTVTETETASSSTSWGGAVAAFKPGCTGGSLSLASPSNVTLPTVTLNGVNQSVTTTGAFTANDQTNSGSGWNIAGTSTTFTNVSSETLPTTATQVTGASAVAGTQNCSLPTNAITYPVTLPAAAIAPTAVKLDDATAGTGAGPATVTLTFKTSVPANAYKGSYTSTWTFSINSGP